MEPKMRLMIVDDELIVRESLLNWFGKYGHGVSLLLVEMLVERKPVQGHRK